MGSSRPELRAVTITILLGTLALTLAVVIGYAWWSSQRGLTQHAHDRVDHIAHSLQNGMALLSDGGADREGLLILLGQLGDEYGANRLEIARGTAVTRQYGPSERTYRADGLARRVLQSGQDVTTIDTSEGRRAIRRLKVLEASGRCLACHDVAPGQVLGVMDVSFDLARVEATGPDYYRNLVLVSVLVTIIAVLLVLLVFSRINMARRIDSVANLAGDIAAGDLDRRVAPLPGTGLDGLARVINEMARSLQAHEGTLARQQHELAAANRRLEVLAQEGHHRIKNNLQTVADLLALQAARCPDEGGACLRDSVQRIKSIATVHELLSAEQAESTDIHRLANRLLEMAVRNVALPDQDIHGSVTGTDLRLPSKQATALALVLSELLNNALVHGLSGCPEGRIAVSVEARNGQARLNVWDDGSGLPDGFSCDGDGRMGLRIVRTLVTRELRGDFEITGNDVGTTASLTFPAVGRDDA